MKAARAESNTPQEKEEARKEKERPQLKPTGWDTQDGEVGTGALMVAFLLLLLKFGEGVVLYGKERENVSKLESTACPWLSKSLLT